MIILELLSIEVADNILDIRIYHTQIEDFKIRQGLLDNIG
ncbi:Hypothetical protein MNA02_1286 [Streptococcus thermophilus]|nr:hypothetical protein Y1U_C1232 [Streptococcus thermophilus MN-ZLW-002]AKH33742.1 Hypothetical protein MNA02_1286 [Streptococcus thermophilus]AOZ59618.1 hypothetical protein BBD27_1534 [Streptococcus thermophilus]KPL38269.1 hypothetical protein ADU38_62 [Streptococcus thermophilus]